MVRYRSSQEGSSLIQVMVAAGILVVVGLGFSTLMTQFYAAQNSASVRQNMSVLAFEVQGIFSNPTACQNSLIPGTTFDLGRAQTIYPSGSFAFGGLPFQMRLNNYEVRSGTRLENYRLQANQFQMVNGRLVGQDESLNPVYRINLIGQFSPSDQNAPGLKDFATMTLASGYVTVTAGTISKCSATSLADIDELVRTCAALGGVYDPVAKKCRISPDLNDPIVIGELCTKLGGSFSNNKCDMGGSATGDNGGTRWSGALVCNFGPASIPMCGGGGPNSAPSAGSPCSPSGQRCSENLGLNQGCGVFTTAYRVWTCN